MSKSYCNSRAKHVIERNICLRYAILLHHPIIQLDICESEQLNVSASSPEIQLLRLIQYEAVHNLPLPHCTYVIQNFLEVISMHRIGF